MKYRCLMRVFFLVLLAGCGKKDPIVAVIGNKQVITLNEFKEDFSRGKSTEAVETSSPSRLLNHLNHMIDTRIKILEAYEMGLERDSAVVAKVVPTRTQALFNRLYETEIVDHMVKETDIRAYFAHMGKEVVIRKITFRCEADSSSEEEAKRKAQDVLSQARAGEDFAALARTHSEDRGSAMNGGLMNPLVWTQQNDPVKDRAFTMQEGDISGLIKDNTGYHIIKVEKIREKERDPYHEVREEIRQNLIAANRQAIAEEARAYWSKVMEDKGVFWNEEELEYLVQRLKSVKDPRRDILADSLDGLSPEEKEKVLVQHKEGQITVQDFEEKIQEYPQHTRFPIDQTSGLKRLFEQWLMRRMLLEKAVSKGLEKDKAVVEELQKTTEQEIVRVLMDRFVIGEIKPREEALKLYYERNREEKYSDPEKVNVQEVMVKDEDMANRIAQWAKAGRDFSKLARDYTERPGYKNKDGILGFFAQGRWGDMGEKAFTLKPGEVAGPIPLKNDRGFSVIKLLEQRPSQVKPYDEVKSRVRNDLIREIKKDREEQWLEEKRNKYSVKTYENVLRKAIPRAS